MKKITIVGLITFLLGFAMGSSGNPDSTMRKQNAHLENVVAWYDTQMKNQVASTKEICKIAEGFADHLLKQKILAQPWECPKETFVPAPTSSVEYLP